MTACKSAADNYDACKLLAGILSERCIGVERWEYCRWVVGRGLWREGVIHSWWMTHSCNNTSEIESAGVVSIYEKLSLLRNAIRNNSWYVHVQMTSWDILDNSSSTNNTKHACKNSQKWFICNLILLFFLCWNPSLQVVVVEYTILVFTENIYKL